MKNATDSKQPTLLKNLFHEGHHTKMLLKKDKFWIPDEDYIYMLSSGVLKIYIYDDNGNERFFRLLKKDDMIFTFSQKIGKKIRILDNTKILMLHKSELINAFSKNQAIFDQFILEVYKVHEASPLRRMSAGNMEIQYKLAILLYEIAKLTSTENRNIHLKDYLTRQDMADYAYAHITTISKILKLLENEGLIEKDGKGIIIKDLHALKNYFEKEYNTINDIQ